MNTYKRLTTQLFILTLGLILLGCDTGSKPEQIWVPETEGILSAAVSNTGKYVLLGIDSGKANVWDISKKKQSLLHSWQHQEGEAGGIKLVDLSYNDNFALTAEENSLAWWDVKAGKILGFWRLEGIKSIAISKDGQSAVVGLRNQAQYFSLKSSQPVFQLKHPDFIKTVALSDDGRYAITGSDNAEAKLWSLKNGKLLHTWKYRNKLFSVALSADGEYAMANAVYGETNVWNTKSGKLIKKIPPNRVTISAAEFNSSGKKLVTARVTQRIDLWIPQTGKLLNSWRPKKNNNWRPSSANILEIKFTNKDKSIISVTSNGIVQRWNSK